MGRSANASSDGQRFDGLFATIAEQAGGIETLFDFFFGFLCRKTDFFTVGHASCKQMLDKSFQKWTQNAKEIEERQRHEREKRQQQEAASKLKQRESQQAGSRSESMISLDGRPKVEELTEEEDALFAPQTQSPDSSNRSTGPEASGEAKKCPQDLQKSEASDADGPEDDQSHRPEGNGGCTDKYRWTQTLEAVDVYVHIGPEVRASQCNVKISGSTLLVGLKGQPPILDGELSQKVMADDSMWTLEDKNTIHLSLEKVDRMRWWSCVLKGDLEIDTKTIVPENSKLSDLDPETRSTVEKMMFDQQQKQRGLPTSDQQRQAQMLDKFKDAHPELDFSGAKINWGNSGWGG